MRITCLLNSHSFRFFIFYFFFKKKKIFIAIRFIKGRTRSDVGKVAFLYPPAAIFFLTMVTDWPSDICVTLGDLEAAHQRIKDHVSVTPTARSRTMDEMTDLSLTFKVRRQFNSVQRSMTEKVEHIWIDFLSSLQSLTFMCKLCVV